MATYIHLNKIYQSNKSFFTTMDIKQLLEIKSNRSVHEIIKKFVDTKILTQIEKGKYYLTNCNVSDFEIAQFIYIPSYISLETALNYHGILSQFPVEITSVTTKSTICKTIMNNIYSYSKINPKLFFGYYKEKQYLIAYPEKALFDQLYFISKGLKTQQYLDEMDYSLIDRRKFTKYVALARPSIARKIYNLFKQHYD